MACGVDKVGQTEKSRASWAPSLIKDRKAGKSHLIPETGATTIMMSACIMRPEYTTPNAGKVNGQTVIRNWEIV